MKEQKGIQVIHVYKSFGKETVLKDVSFTIPPGSIDEVYLRVYEM